MNILVAGSGGREHAIAWKLARDRKRSRIFCAPGNAGTALVPGCTNIPAHGNAEVVAAAIERDIDLVVVGPEEPLVNGLADDLRTAAIPCLGPTRAAAALEGSKIAAKEFMSRHGIPTAAYEVARTPQEAMAAVDHLKPPVVLKADGLAAGKGVVVCTDRSAALETVHAFMVERSLGTAGRSMVVEDCLEGYEVTILAFTDGRTLYELPASQDHKPIGEGNTGPNTGGMGVVCPHPRFTEELHERVRAEILEPTREGIREDGLDYRGVLYFGLMVTADGPFVLEYNVRLGDPEAQAVLPLVDTDLAELARATATGRLEEIPPPRRKLSSCVVVAASGGYPGPYDVGFPIGGIAECENPVFMAGVQEVGGELVTAGGRVLSVCGLGRTAAEARQAAYRDMKRLSFTGMYYRSDIGAPPARDTT